MVRDYDENGFPVTDKKTAARERLLRQLELRKEAQALMRRMSIVDNFQSSDPEVRKMVPICDITKEILRNKVRNEPFRAGAIEAIRQAMNIPVSRSAIREYLEGDPPVRYVYLFRPGPREAAEHLVRFLRLFAMYPELENHNPIALCPWCDAVFLKAKSRQKFCSSRCRSSAFNAAAGSDYFRKKAKDYRDVKRCQKEAAGKRKRAG